MIEAETVKWRTYNHDRDAYNSVSKTHIFDVANKTLCGIEIPSGPIYNLISLQPSNCKRCLAKHKAA